MAKKFVNLYGPPGTGKTTTLVDMIQKSAKVGNVHVVSYTKAAAKEIAERASKVSNGVWAGTLHSLCFSRARLSTNSVVNDDKLKSFSSAIGIPISAVMVSSLQDYEQQEVGNAYMRLISLARSRMRPFTVEYDHSERPGNPQEFIKFVRGYHDWKNTYGFYDFDDMLEMNTTMGPLETDFLFIDEAQDLSPLQWAVIDEMVGRGGVPGGPRGVVVAGDDDQAIHEWAGADPQGMRRFSDTYSAEARVLSQSYRLPESVYHLSKSIISRVADRVDKPFNPVAGKEGSVTRAGTMHQAHLAPGALVLARNHAIFKELTESMNAAHIPYSGAGSPLYRGLSELALRFHEGKTAKLSMPALYAARRIYGDRAAEDIAEGLALPFDPLIHYQSDGSNEYLSGLISKYGSITEARAASLELCTIHSSKGREADNVVLINGMTDRTAENYAKNRDSELRVFYVGVTRARHHLSIVDWNNSVEIFS